MRFKEYIKEKYNGIKTSVRRIIDYHRIWFSYYRVCKGVYDFDYWSLYALSEHQLERLKDCLKNENLYEGVERDVERMDLALRLLNIIKKDDILKRIDKDGNEIESLDNWLEGTYECTKYVNIKNNKRFGFEDSCFTKKDESLNEIMKSTLYVEKAWYLYHKLLTYYAKYWWS